MISREQKPKDPAINEESQKALTTEDAKNTLNLFMPCAESGDRTDCTKESAIDEISAEKSSEDASKQAYYQKRLHTVTQHIEKLFAHCKTIESENKVQKEQINSVLQNFDKFSEKLETLSAKTSKIKQNFEEGKQKQFPTESMNNLKLQQKRKKKGPTHFQIKAYILQASSKDNTLRTFNNLPNLRKMDVSVDSRLERKESRHCNEMTCDKIMGDTDKSCVQACPNTFKTDIEELRKIFINIKKSVLMGSSDASKDDLQPSIDHTNDEKTVKAMSDLVCQKILKILDQMLCEDSNKIKYNVNGKDSEWKLAALSQEKEGTINRQLCDANMMETVAKQLENIQNKVEQISATNALLNAQMLKQKQDIINLNGRLQAIHSPNVTQKEVLDWHPEWSQFCGDPDFVIARLLKNVENIAVQIQSQKDLHCQSKETYAKSKEEMMENKFNQSDSDPGTLHAEMCSPPQKLIDCEFQSAIRNTDLQQTHLGIKSKVSAAQNEFSHKAVLSEMKISVLENSTKSSCKDKKSITGMNSAYTCTYSPVQDPLHASKTNCVSDVVSKEIDKRIPELFRVSRIPKLLDEIASSVAPLTMSKRRLSNQMPNDNKRYHEVKKNGSLLRKNIFKNTTDIKQKNFNLPKSLTHRKSDTLGSGINEPKHTWKSNLNRNLTPKNAAEHATSRKKFSCPNVFMRKENSGLYSSQFLASVKKSFVDIIPNEIKKSITGLAVKENSPSPKSEKSTELNATSTSSSNLKPVGRLESKTQIKLRNVPKKSESRRSDQLFNLQYDLASKTELTSQITLACVQKFIAAVETEKNQQENMSFIFKGNKIDKTMNNDKSLNSKPVGNNQTEYFLQKFKKTTMPNFFVALPGVKIFDSFWGGPDSSFSTFAEKLDTLGSNKLSNRACSSKINLEQISLSNETNDKKCPNMSACKCSRESFSDLEDSVNG